VSRLAAGLLTLLLVAGCGGTTAGQQEPLRLPDRALPAFGGSGQDTNLRSLEGPAVLNLWAQWCHPCRRELPVYQAFHAAHPGVKVLGVNWRESNHANAVRLLAATKVTYPSVVDRDGTVVRASALPTLILVDAHGRVAFNQALEIKSLGQLESLVRRHLGVHL
jgi:thiol-disulfide isomerase/thioredoxin